MKKKEAVVGRGEQGRGEGAPAVLPHPHWPAVEGDEKEKGNKRGNGKKEKEGGKGREKRGALAVHAASHVTGRRTAPGLSCVGGGAKEHRGSRG